MLALSRHRVQYLVVKDDLHPTRLSAQNQMKGGIFSDIVFCQGANVLQIHRPIDQSLMIWGYTLSVLNPLLDAPNCVVTCHIQYERFACQGLYEYYHCHTF
jgi:hypothetical protein